MAEARDFHCTSYVVDIFGKKPIPSDHAAVRLVIQKPTHRGDLNQRIPSWMSKHPIFSSILQQLRVDHRFSPDPFCALAEFKLLLHQAQKMTQRELSKQTPDCVGAKLLITSTALRAYRNRHLGTLMPCCKAWKPIEDCFDTLFSSVLTSSDFATSLLAVLVKTLNTISNTAKSYMKNGCVNNNGYEKSYEKQVRRTTASSHLMAQVLSAFHTSIHGHQHGALSLIRPLSTSSSSSCLSPSSSSTSSCSLSSSTRRT